jgi:hypothetical protein
MEQNNISPEYVCTIIVQMATDKMQCLEKVSFFRLKNVDAINHCIQHSTLINQAKVLLYFSEVFMLISYKS